MLWWKVFFFLLWTPTSLSKGSFLNTTKNLQHLEKRLDFRSLRYHNKTFLCSNCFWFSSFYERQRYCVAVWYFDAHLKHEFSSCTLSLQKKNKGLSPNLCAHRSLYFHTEIWFVKCPVTDCVFVENLLSKSTQQIPNNHNHFCSSEVYADIWPDFPDICLMVWRSSVLA